MSYIIVIIIDIVSRVQIGRNQIVHYTQQSRYIIWVQRHRPCHYINHILRTITPIIGVRACIMYTLNVK